MVVFHGEYALNAVKKTSTTAAGILTDGLLFEMLNCVVYVLVSHKVYTVYNLKLRVKLILYLYLPP